MSGREVTDEQIERVSRGWLAYQANQDPQHEEAMLAMQEWLSGDDESIKERFILQVCRDVNVDDDDLIGMIGAGPLESLLFADPDRALQFLESESETNVTLRKALATVWLYTEPGVRKQIDAILARYGDTQPDS